LIDAANPPTVFEDQVRKRSRPLILAVNEATRDEIETRTFELAYKGVTDIVTKHVFPRPAFYATRFAARRGVKPNTVTTVSLLLVFVVLDLFARDQLAIGLCVGFAMSFLDTVDGKLARVTLTSSKFGHLFDHVLDLVHPPFWYLAWGAGLASYQPTILSPDLGVAIWIIFLGYIAGRLLEGSFQLLFGRFGIFSWKKLDSYSRLITARRNPCLILLTVGAIFGRPDLGLEHGCLQILAHGLRIDRPGSWV